MYSILVFDWDGTLFDSVAYKRRNAGEVFYQRYGVRRALAEECFTANSGLPRYELFNLMSIRLRDGRGLTDAEYGALSDEFSELNIGSSKRARPFPEAGKCLSDLKAMGKKIYVSSSSVPAELLVVAQGSGLFEFLENVFGSQPGFSKGEEHFERVMRTENCARDALLFVGNDKKDLELGQQAGVVTWLLNREQSQSPEFANAFPSLTDVAHRLCT